jgi:hypothetical protein
MRHLKVFQAIDGELVAKQRLPAILTQAANDAYHAASGMGVRIRQSRLDELIACGKKLLADSANGTGSIPHYYRPSDNQAEKLNDLVSRTHRRTHAPLWRPFLRDSDAIDSSQLLAAYALLQIDRAASHYLADNFKKAVAALALATVATADYGFHWGFSDHAEVLRTDSRINSRKSGRLLGTEAAKRHAIELWKNGPAAGTQWKSKLGFAKAVEDEVVAVAARNGLRLVPTNAVRTIREWIVAEEKRRK